MERNLENVHVVIYSKKMLKEAVRRLTKLGQNVEIDIICEFEFHGNDILVYNEGLFTVAQFPPNYPNQEITLNDLCEMIIGEESKIKELEVGRWYILDKYSDIWAGKPTVNGILCYKGNSEGYGFNLYGEWRDSFNFNESYPVLREATPQEVEEALIKEAKKRYKVGDKLSKVYKDCSKGNRIFSEKIHYQKSDSTLWIDNDSGTTYSSCIFKNGKWAEVIEDEKFKIGDWIVSALKNDPQFGFTVFQILHQHTADHHNKEATKSLYNIHKISNETAERLRKELLCGKQ